MNSNNADRRILSRLYGGLEMNWPRLLLFAVCTAALTSVFLIVPVFQDSSFELMGVQFEAWIFFAVIIMANCKKPLESACKTFVFFLISQPLIYLFQVPFSWLGWGLFGYYRFWFILTLLTFPAAFVGWYITKKNWLSVLILAPILAYLGITACTSALHCIRHFPRQLITALFCLMQIVLYALVFFPGKKKLVGLAVPVLAAVILAMTSHETDVNATLFLPNDPVLSDSAVVVMEEDPGLRISVEKTGQDSMIRIQAKRLGSTDFSIQDGELAYEYTAEIYEDDGGSIQIRIRERGN